MYLTVWKVTLNCIHKFKVLEKNNKSDCVTNNLVNFFLLKNLFIYLKLSLCPLTIPPSTVPRPNLSLPVPKRVSPLPGPPSPCGHKSFEESVHLLPLRSDQAVHYYICGRGTFRPVAVCYMVAASVSGSYQDSRGVETFGLSMGLPSSSASSILP